MLFTAPALEQVLGPGAHQHSTHPQDSPLPVFLAFALRLSSAPAQTIRVDITPGHSTNKFVPNQALGAGIGPMPAS